MISENNRSWIDVGYAAFAEEGPKGLRIESFARRIGKSKSSFYHHFADLELFTELLLQQHLERAADIAQRMRQCERMDPDMLDLFLSVRSDILFQRQLRIHRDKVAFRNCFEQAHAPIEEALLSVWTQALDLQGRDALARGMLRLVVENFYLRVTDDTLSRAWLIAYLTEIQAMVATLSEKR